MRAIIDGDILRYEIGHAAETGWRAITEDEDALPPFDYVRDLLLQRVAYILEECGCDTHTIYITEGPTFRFDIAKRKPYKGTRKPNKPWHYKNLSMYLVEFLGSTVVTGIEADDAMAIDHVNDPDSVLCSRDKDLRQVPGMYFSWELGNSPAFGPVMIDDLGEINLTPNRKDIKGTGFAFFAAQMLIGDKVDNIPGLPFCGPVAAIDVLSKCATKEEYMDTVIAMYSQYYGDEWRDELLEQGRLCWLLRYLNEDGSIPLWTPGDYE
ncbi:MAG: hypothetical protein ACXABY_32125 [Candidatus Thorarchaeota archaeon]|jgi:hypothetical protein